MTRFLMDDASIPDPNLAETQIALQEIRDLPAALLKITFDLVFLLTIGRNVCQKQVD